MQTRIATSLVAFALTLAAESPATAQLPDAKTLLTDLGFSASDIQDVLAGKFVQATIAPSSERELVAALAFFVKVPPADLEKEMRAGLLNKVDENVLAWGDISAVGTVADLAKLTLAPNADKRAQAYVNAKAGGDLYLSTAEIAGYNKLGSGAGGSPATAAVEQQIRTDLIARYQAYKAKGLAGTAPYDFGGGKQRSPGDELRSATMGSKALATYASLVHQVMLSYPQSKPAGMDEVFRWLSLEAHGVPTLILVHGFVVPDGDGWVAVQRQYFVSGGFNAEQAVAAFLPVTGGTVVVYSNRTSTDQVTGFGGGAKRSIGGKMLVSQLEAIFTKLQSEAPKDDQ